MGATSVTGTGKGAAFNNKGPHNGRDQFVPLLSPHVVLAGNITLTGTTGTVTFVAPMPSSKTNYVVMVTATSGTTLPVVTTKTDVNSLFTSFVITGGSGSTNDYMVCTVGHGA